MDNNSYTKEQILSTLRCGKKIRRKHWPEGIYGYTTTPEFIYGNHIDLLFNNQEFLDYLPVNVDSLGDGDWEIYDERPHDNSAEAEDAWSECIATEVKPLKELIQRLEEQLANSNERIAELESLCAGKKRKRDRKIEEKKESDIKHAAIMAEREVSKITGKCPHTYNYREIGMMDIEFYCEACGEHVG